LPTPLEANITREKRARYKELCRTLYILGGLGRAGGRRLRESGAGIGGGGGGWLFLFKGFLGSFRERRILRFRFLWRDRFCFPSRVPVLELLKAEKGSGDLAVEGDFVAEQEFVGANALVASAKGHDRAQGGIFRVAGDGGDVIVEVGLLDAPNSRLTPAGRDVVWVGVEG
jgi:hypothetical protein